MFIAPTVHYLLSMGPTQDDEIRKATLHDEKAFIW